MKVEHQIFDAHFHIIDEGFPLVANRGYLPESFDRRDYIDAVEQYDIIGGAIVSGSFQAFDQTYLVDALESMGSSYVGVTQLPTTVSDSRLVELDEAGVRALRFNLKRGGSETIAHLSSMAHRVHDVAGWHVELYIDSCDLEELTPVVTSLPAVSIDHLGLSRDGFPRLLRLAEQGIHIKASGFGRVDFPVAPALREIYDLHPEVLMFGTDLPSTRAPRPFRHKDIELILDTFQGPEIERILSRNALNFYRIP